MRGKRTKEEKPVTRLHVACTIVGVFLSVPFALFINGIELLVAFLQAYIFTMLTSLFIGMAAVLVTLGYLIGHVVHPEGGGRLGLIFAVAMTGFIYVEPYEVRISP